MCTGRSSDDGDIISDVNGGDVVGAIVLVTMKVVMGGDKSGNGSGDGSCNSGGDNECYVVAVMVARWW